MRQHFLSLTADQERFNASPAVRRHHDESEQLSDKLIQRHRFLLFVYAFLAKR
jgi:hypothetical protein